MNAMDRECLCKARFSSIDGALAHAREQRESGRCFVVSVPL